MVLEIMEKIIKDIGSQEISSAYIEAPFDVGKTKLEKQGYEIISFRDNAMLSIQEGIGAFISQSGNWVIEGVVYVPKKGRFFTPDSPIMDNSFEAICAQRKEGEFYINDEQVERALENSIQIPYNIKNIPVKEFGEEPITIFCFKDMAKKYGEFLEEAGINRMRLRLHGKYQMENQIKVKPYANQLRLSGFRVDEVDIYGNYSNMAYGYGCRGIQKNDAKSYSLNQIKNALKKKGLTRIEKILVSGLKE